MSARGTDHDEGDLKMASAYVASEYESGWYVEKASISNICALEQVAGPFQTAEDAEAMIRTLEKANAKRKENKHGS